MKSRLAHTEKIAAAEARAKAEKEAAEKDTIKKEA
jgi:hypothetical protein